MEIDADDPCLGELQDTEQCQMTLAPASVALADVSSLEPSSTTRILSLMVHLLCCVQLFIIPKDLAKP